MESNFEVNWIRICKIFMSCWICNSVLVSKNLIISSKTFDQNLKFHNENSLKVKILHFNKLKQKSSNIILQILACPFTLKKTLIFKSNLLWSKIIPHSLFVSHFCTCSCYKCSFHLFIPLKIHTNNFAQTHESEMWRKWRR